MSASELQVLSIYTVDADRIFLCSPYTRETYRYTPLLALLLAPNEWLHPSYGKYMFATCDILNGILIFKLLRSVILPSVLSTEPKPKETIPAHVTATLYASLHLLNPLVFTISTRGSSESVLTSLVLLTLYYALNDRWDVAALLLGLSTHWKVFPVIYGVGCLGVIGHDPGGQPRQGRFGGWVGTIVNARTLRFGVISAGTFFALGIGCYLV